MAVETHGAPASAARARDDDEATSVRSSLSNLVVGDFLGARHPPVRHTSAQSTETSPLLAAPVDEDVASVAPAIPSMGNASGFGTIRPPSTAMWPGAEADGDDISDDVLEPSVQHELYAILKYTLPISATHLLELSLSVVSIFSLGHLGTVELAAASLAGMTANVTGFSVISGLITALDTLLPASYTSRPELMGLWTQRVGVILLMTLPWIFALWLNAEKGLLLLGQAPDIAKRARDFLAILSIGLPGHAIFELCRRFLQAQGLMHAPTMVLLVVSPLNAVANFLLVWGPPSIRFGFIGAPMASAFSMWLAAALCCLQCMVVTRHTWGGWSKDAFDPAGLRKCWQLGLAGLFSLASEWWAWEIVGLVTAALGTTALASQSVLLIISSVTYQLPSGASIAASVRVGHHLGAGHAAQAHIAARASLVLSIAMGLLNSSLVVLTRHRLGYLFSSDKAVIHMVASVLPLVALFQCADCVCGMAGGILRGSGRPALSAMINLTAYYVVGIPISLILAFRPWHYGLAGLWWGLTIALAYGALTSLWYIQRTNWTHVMHSVHHAVRSGPDGA